MIFALMKMLLIYLSLLFAPGDSLLVMFWNLENFFDPADSLSCAADHEFSPEGERHWTRRRFYRKCELVSKAVLWLASREDRFPDIIAVAEIENRFVLRSVLRTTALSKLDYGIVHFDSPDPRGIDVGLFYRKSTLRKIRSKPCPVPGVATRDILLAEFQHQPSSMSSRPSAASGEISILVNHHPSKYGGATSAGRREKAVDRLAFLADSLAAEGHGRIIAIGDMNDTPDNPVYSRIPLINASLPLHRAGEGSIRFNGKWELIDLVFLSPELAQSRVEVAKIPFLLTKDTLHSGLKPLRTYTGPRYAGGVSDHLPILVKIP